MTTGPDEIRDVPTYTETEILQFRLSFGRLLAEEKKAVYDWFRRELHLGNDAVIEFERNPVNGSILNAHNVMKGFVRVADGFEVPFCARIEGQERYILARSTMSDDRTGVPLSIDIHVTARTTPELVRRQFMSLEDMDHMIDSEGNLQAYLMYVLADWNIVLDDEVEILARHPLTDRKKSTTDDDIHKVTLIYKGGDKPVKAEAILSCRVTGNPPQQVQTPLLKKDQRLFSGRSFPFEIRDDKIVYTGPKLSKEGRLREAAMKTRERAGGLLAQAMDRGYSITQMMGQGIVAQGQRAERGLKEITVPERGGMPLGADEQSVPQQLVDAIHAASDEPRQSLNRNQVFQGGLQAKGLREPYLSIRAQAANLEEATIMILSATQQTAGPFKIVGGTPAVPEEITMAQVARAKALARIILTWLPPRDQAVIAAAAAPTTANATPSHSAGTTADIPTAGHAVPETDAAERKLDAAISQLIPNLKVDSSILFEGGDETEGLLKMYKKIKRAAAEDVSMATRLIFEQLTGEELTPATFIQHRQQAADAKALALELLEQKT